MTERTVLVRLRATSSQFQREMVQAAAAVKLLSRELNTSNDQTSWLVGSLTALAPAAVPIGATVVPTIAGLATGMTLAAGAAVTLGLAFNGVGDALDALNKYQLDPTEENLAALHEQMKVLGPDGAEFVQMLDAVGAQLSILQRDARVGMFPGMAEGLDALVERLPELRAVVTQIGGALGDLSADSGMSLASDEWDAFFTYIEANAKPLMVEMGHAVGNFAHGFAEMVVAFGPLTDDFSAGLLNMSESFEAWASGLSGSQGFRDFIDYIRDHEDDVGEFFGALADDIVKLVAAAAPAGEVVLPLLTNMLKLLGEILDTPVGPIAILAVSLASLAGRLVAVSQLLGGGVIGGALTGQLRRVGDEAGRSALGFKAMHGGAAVAGVALALLSDSISETLPHTSELAKVLGAGLGAGAVAGPIAGAAAALGTALVGALGAASDAQKAYSTTSADLIDTLDDITGAATKASRAMLLQDLQGSGAAAAAARQGVNSAALVEAIIGDPEAIAQVNAQLAKSVDGMARLHSFGGVEWTEFDPEVAADVKLIADAVGGLGGELDKTRQEFVDAALATGSWMAGLAGLPTDVQTKITIAAADGKAELARVLGLLDLTDEQRTAVIKAYNALQPTLGKINRDLNSTASPGGKPRLGEIMAQSNAGSVARASAILDFAARTRTAYINVQTVGSISGDFQYVSPTGEADGGTLDFYASGGLRENHVAQIAPAGAWRVWAEPETQGEAYIPFAPSKRARSLQVWAETGRRLGVQGFGGGGVAGSPTASPSAPPQIPPMVASLVGAEISLDPSGAARFVAGQLRMVPARDKAAFVQAGQLESDRLR